MGLDSLYLLIQSLALYVFGANSQIVVNPKLNFALAVVGMIGFAVLLAPTAVSPGGS